MRGKNLLKICRDSIQKWLSCLSPHPFNITDKKGHLLNQIVLKVRIEIQARIPDP
jgi:hypothetical protein